MTAQPVLPTPDAAPGLCICGRPLPVRRASRVAATFCSWWCKQAAAGTYTLAQIEPMLPPKVVA